MPDKWLFKSETYDNCNCDINCGCQFNVPSTHGYCESRPTRVTSSKAITTIHLSQACIGQLCTSGRARFMGALLRSPLRSGWPGPRAIKAHGVAWHLSLWSLDRRGSMTASITRARRWPGNVPTVFETVLRRDRATAALVLVAVLAASWLYLLAGAGTGMYPHEMAVLIPAISVEPSMAGMMMSPTTWTPGYALVMFSMWWLMMAAMMLSGAAPMVLLHAKGTRGKLTAPYRTPLHPDFCRPQQRSLAGIWSCGERSPSWRWLRNGRSSAKGSSPT